MSYFDEQVEAFRSHYAQRLGKTAIRTKYRLSDMVAISVTSPDLKDGNEPRMYLHKKPSDHVIVLAHGLSDSPFYISAIGNAFFKAGANVIIPLMPAHGLKDPNAAMEDFKMDTKWRNEIDISIDIAQKLGNIISLGGFSAGGALCYNKILRDPAQITGGLFLFSAAIDVRLISELGQSRFISAIVRMTDGEIKGYGMDPYKYPKLPLFAALELGQVINQNEELSDGVRITQPVFAAHTINDNTAKLSAIQKLIKKHSEIGMLYTIWNKMAHAELPLKKDIKLNKDHSDGKPAYANPDFDLMMKSCLSFYKKHVLGMSKS